LATSPDESIPPTPPPKSPKVELAVPVSDRVFPTPSSSTALGTSTKDFDLFDYYSEKQDRGFAPVISPIIEESSSQLSSPGSKRLSSIGTPKSRTMSPLSGTTHGMLSSTSTLCDIS
jgi:hypothetical protein